MTDDRALARLLTDAVLATPGIAAVFPVQPILHAASEGIASVLDLAEPEVLVDLDHSESLLTVTAHVATTSDCSTPEVLGRAAEVLRAVAQQHDGEVVVFVKARLIAEPQV